MTPEQLILASNVISHAQSIKNFDEDDLKLFVETLQSIPDTMPNISDDDLKKIWGSIFKLYSQLGNKSATASKE